MIDPGRIRPAGGVVARWWRSRAWWQLGAGIVAGPVAGFVAGIWLPAHSAVLVGGLAMVVAEVMAPLVDRAKADMAVRWQRRRELPSQGVGVSESGRLPRVRECTDPVALGVHPAAMLADGNRVPPFVARDVDDELRLVLGRPGFVLVVGESTAGKSRAAYEAVRVVLPDHVLVQPASGDVLTALAPVVAEQARCVVWLDDLERYLSAGEMSSELLTRLLGDGSRHVVVVATMRTQEHARYDRARESGLEDASRPIWRRGRDVLERAYEISLDRRWSAGEVERARRFADDPRIAQAVKGVGRFGVAEILAGGPELVGTLRNAWTPGQHPRAAAMVMAAVDCRRARLHRPVSADLLGRLHKPYLAARGGIDLRPETTDEALAFATAPVYATTSLLLPDGEGAYLAHDYLIDALPANPIPDNTWRLLLAHVTAQEAFDIGAAAFDAHRFEPARDAFARAAEAEVPHARYMLGLTMGEAGRPAEAAKVLGDLLADRIAMLGPDHRETQRTHYQLARHVGRAGDSAAATTILRELLADRNRVLGADHPDTLATRHELAYWTGEAGNPVAAVIALRDLLADRVRVLGADHPNTLATRHELAQHMGRAGDPAAAVTAFRELLPDSIRVWGADHVDTLTTRGNLACWTAHAGDPVAAVTALRELLADQTRVMGPDHPGTLTTRGHLAGLVGKTGNPVAAVTAFRELLPDAIRVLGIDHLSTLTNRAELARYLGATGDAVAAVTGLREVLADQIRVMGADHPGTLNTRHNLAYWTDKAGDQINAIAIMRDLLAHQIRVLGAAHPTVQETRHNLVYLASKASDQVTADTVLRALVAHEIWYGPGRTLTP
jgi:hypothetical protein